MLSNTRFTANVYFSRIIAHVHLPSDGEMLSKGVLYRSFAKNLIRVAEVRPGTPRKMSWVSVRKVTSEERVQISFSYTANGTNTQPRSFNMDRLGTEELEKTLARIQTNVSKVLNKKKNKKQKKDGAAAASAENEEIQIAVALLDPEGTATDGSVTNAEAWQDGSTLVLGDNRTKVRVNVPLVKEIILPNCVMAGFTIFPKVDAEFIDLEKCVFAWYREKKGAAENSEVEWELVQEGFSYMVVNKDIDSRLKLTCVPSNGKEEGIVKETITKSVVMAGPGHCPFENRHEHTQTLTTSGSIRVMTYNILADSYADSDFSRNSLYPYCPPYALDRDYRKHLLLKEIIGYNTDIICLQEVDQKLFIHDLAPRFEMEGFEGLLKLKLGQVREGSALFFRKSKFRLLSQHDIGVTESLMSDPLYKDLWDRICTNEVFKEKMEERSTVLQVLVLESTESPEKKVVVGTTHLYFHPRASHIRMLQTAICLRHLGTVIDKYSVEGSPKPAVIFSGDLNSYPEGGVHQLIDQKSIPSHHADWYSGGMEEYVDNMTLTNDLDLTSACGFPRYTNFVSSFTGCLDYIYVDKHRLKPTKVVPMPTHDEVTQFTALPNAVFPSDHIALICDLDWI